MWTKQTKSVEKPRSLLRDLCKGDAKLFDCLTNNMYENPFTAIPKTNLDVLTAEVEESGHFELAVDKAIFEAAQNPGERERYITVIHNLASKAFHATEQEQERLEREGHADLTAGLRRRIIDQKLISERTEEVIDVASGFYNEKLVGLRESVRRDAREEERRSAQREEGRIEALEKEGREARKQERKEMGRDERKEAEKRDRVEEAAAQDRKETRAAVRKGAEMEAGQIETQEEVSREARKEERRGS